MRWNLSISHPWWMVVIAVLVALLYAFVLYYFKSRQNQQNQVLGRWRIVLSFLRFIVVFVLTFLLLEPVLQYVGFRSERPVVALVVDNSKSMLGEDSVAQRDVLLNSLRAVNNGLSPQYDVEVFRFSAAGEAAVLDDIDFSGGRTDAVKGLYDANELLLGTRHVASVVWSDGIVNKGRRLEHVSEGWNPPVYAVAVGDTTSYVDARIAEVEYNRLAYLGNQWPVRVSLEANKLSGKNMVLQVFHLGKLVASKSLAVQQDRFFDEYEFLLTSNVLGRNRVEVVLSTADGERNVVNNKKTVFVEVVESRKKIEVWANAPHPDIGAMLNTIQLNDRYQANAEYANFEIDEDMSLVILHHWFQNEAQLALFEALKAKGIAVCVVLGPKTQARYLNTSTSGIQLDRTGEGVVSTLPELSNRFEYFELSEETRASVAAWPPLEVPFGKLRGFTSSDVLIYQRLGQVATQEPLVAVKSLTSGYRLGLISGEGLWMWRLQNYAKHQHHQHIAELLNGMVQYLTIRRDRNLLSVESAQEVYFTNEEIALYGDLYNKSMQTVSNASIEVELIAESGDKNKLVMQFNGLRYSAAARGLSAGNYQFIAKAEVGGEVFSDKGYFTVEGHDAEYQEMQANHKALEHITNASSGALFYLGQEAAVVETLLGASHQAVLKKEKTMRELVQLKWVFFLLVILLFVEWFARKWKGGV